MPSPDGRVDLRSDTVTRPSAAMRAAMVDAEVGDDVYGEDPTVERLQSLAAGLLEREAALFTPSGTMANQLALRVLGWRGARAACGTHAHVRCFEAPPEEGAGMEFELLDDTGGTFSGAQLAAASSPSTDTASPLVMATLENTATHASGRPWRPDELGDVVDAARFAGLSLHCDGARIWNASVALGTSPVTLTAGFDTVMFCFSKGLGAPVGSILCGPADVVAAARVQRHHLGGAMRQAGVLAAAAIVALETSVRRLAEDHARARRLAEHLADRFPGSVEPATVETNIVCACAPALPPRLLHDLEDRGVLAGRFDETTIRFVTHGDVDDQDLERALAALDQVALETTR